MDTQSLPSAPPALTDLTAAGLVSHEMIGDPAQLGSEAEALRVLCAQIGGPVWRLDPFHYAFRARPDLGGRLAEIAPEGWTAALEAALRAELGADAVWISSADSPPAAAGLPDLPLLLLRAQAEAVAAGARGGRAGHPGGGPGPLCRRDGAAGRRRRAGKRAGAAAGGDRDPPGGDPRDAGGARRRDRHPRPARRDAGRRDRAARRPGGGPGSTPAESLAA